MAQQYWLTKGVRCSSSGTTLPTQVYSCDGGSKGSVHPHIVWALTHSDHSAGTFTTCKYQVQFTRCWGHTDVITIISNRSKFCGCIQVMVMVTWLPSEALSALITETFNETVGISVIEKKHCAIISHVDEFHGFCLQIYQLCGFFMKNTYTIVYTVPANTLANYNK